MAGAQVGYGYTQCADIHTNLEAFMTPFERIVPKHMRQLIADFNLGDSVDEEILGAAAIMGNGAYESGGFEHFQEINPTAGRGGFGWFQWTGTRRKQFEAYCARNNLDPTSDKANYAFLFVELTGPEKKAIPAIRAVTGLENKVITFEANFERAGVKAYPKRVAWAQKCVDLYVKTPVPDVVASPPPAITPSEDKRNITLAAVISAIITTIFGFLVAYFGG